MWSVGRTLGGFEGKETKASRAMGSHPVAILTPGPAVAEAPPKGSPCPGRAKADL